jgi:hypothetical protein
MADRKRPGEGTAEPEAAAASNGKTPKAKSEYHVYQEDGDALVHLGSYMGRNAEQSVAAFIESGDHADVAEAVKSGEAALVVIPERNHTRVRAQVETKTRVKLSAV